MDVEVWKSGVVDDKQFEGNYGEISGAEMFYLMWLIYVGKIQFSYQKIKIGL